MRSQRDPPPAGAPPTSSTLIFWPSRTQLSYCAAAFSAFALQSDVTGLVRIGSLVPIRGASRHKRAAVSSPGFPSEHPHLFAYTTSAVPFERPLLSKLMSAESSGP